MEAILFVCAIICVLVGYIAARIEFNKKLASAKETHFNSGFKDGFDRAFQDVDAVRRAYIYHFHTK